MYPGLNRVIKYNLVHKAGLMEQMISYRQLYSALEDSDSENLFLKKG